MGRQEKERASFATRPFNRHIHIEGKALSLSIARAVIPSTVPLARQDSDSSELVGQADSNNVIVVKRQLVVFIQLVNFVINKGRHVFVEVVDMFLLK